MHVIFILIGDKMGDNDDIGAMVIQLMKPHVSPFPSGWLP